ncbi:Protein import receptor MAS20,Mitochondrial outer membrane translocase complex, subunit Tom20 domain [Cinara cedri]|uniref:Protein import receptor MAS20,Mitochondrial outer membrane translocase complex, subunit Tom20 domain n=1 Tax=Cinara cedri TaxID=506608 RepID=A0A5E4NJS2_9HEMI|nr:Protein import receptor MAS20,Mitochondrial outer membrane translocase complex, subunit Tom20 domain [Cinara cedri]
MSGLLLSFTGCSVFMVVAVLSYYMYCLDKKRISDPCYKSKVEANRNMKKQQEAIKLKHRMLIFPKSNDMKDIKRFVFQEIDKAEECMLRENYDKAVEHFANGLSLIEDNGKLLNNLGETLPSKMFGEIEKQIQEIKKMLPIINS